MAAKIVVGIFESRGYAQDARNRLHTEGVAEGDMWLAVLREIVSPPPESIKSDLAALSFAPLVVGDVERNYAHFIRNGETAVLVRAETDADVQFAIDVMSLFAPMAVEILKREVVRDL